MKRKQALLLYLAGTFGQILLVSLLVWLLRAGEVRVDYGTPIGLFTLMLGGLSSAIWGAIISIRYHHSSFKQLVSDFFQVKQPLSPHFSMFGFSTTNPEWRYTYPSLVFPHNFICKSPRFWWNRRNWLALFFPAYFARKVDLSSVYAVYLCSLVTMAFTLFLHWWVSDYDSFIAIFARLIKQLFHLIRNLYKDQKPLALCDDTCVDQCFIATVISWEHLVIPCD